MTLNLAAIRARDAACRLVAYHVTCQDRRALLAEVDRLTDTLALVDDDRMFRAEQLQRALPVIEAARALLTEEEDGYFVYTKPNREAWEALRAALAEYDR